MEALPYSLSRWTTEELLGEIVRRNAMDAPALQFLEGIVIRARLDEADGRLDVEAGEVNAAGGSTRVVGTMEMGLADD